MRTEQRFPTKVKVTDIYHLSVLVQHKKARTSIFIQLGRLFCILVKRSGGF